MLQNRLEFNGTHTRALTHAYIRLVYTIVFEEARFVDLIVHVRLLSYSDHDVTFSLYDGVIICKFFSHT